MTRSQVISELQKMGYAEDHAIRKYEDIKEFLYSNNCRIKDIRKLKKADDQDDDMVYINLFDDGFGWLVW